MPRPVVRLFVLLLGFVATAAGAQFPSRPPWWSASLPAAAPTPWRA
jgi:hypothetical protein